jgi:hypothetical protein
MNKKSKTSIKYTLRRPNTPRQLLIKMFKNIKQKNLYKSPKFWLSNILFMFIVLKTFQMYFYLKEFEITIPKEEAMNNMIYLDNKQLSKMDPAILFKYLDELEKKKEERKLNGLGEFEHLDNDKKII